MDRFSKAQRIGLVAAAIFFVAAGCLHFAKPAPYIKIVPPWLPWPAQLVAVSGFFEILGGLGLLIPSFRRAAAWGLVSLLIAVFPANLYMAASPAAVGASSIPKALLWVRLPLQAGFIWWVLWSSRPRHNR
jgi:uncharacterized membrane protein